MFTFNWFTSEEMAATEAAKAQTGMHLWKVVTSFGGSNLFVQAETLAEARTLAKETYNSSEYCFVEYVRRATDCEILDFQS